MASVLIVDGYNVIQAADRYATLARRDMDAARALLVADVAAHAHDVTEALIVFDGAENPASDGAPHDAAGVTVVFSAYGHEADEVIEELAARRRGAGDQVTVVTSDAETQWVTLGLGAERLSSGEFAEAMSAERLERQESATTFAGKRVAVEDLLDASTREALSSWARGRR
ncbi:MAG: NYN domain-containing protein [Coriobacteriia bacterium]|nr:NYN domain-containing protein [Coriobacteriia bacterium]